MNLKSLHCIAIDDEPLALELIDIFCAELDFIDLKAGFTQSSAARQYIANNSVDLIFLDISMPDINGIDFYKSLGQEQMVIFTTAHSEYAVEGFNVNAVDYLLKPLSRERFQQACSKAKDFYYYNKMHSKEQYIYVRSEYALIKIDLKEVLFFETLDDYIKIHLVDKKPILTLMSMKKMQEKLPEEHFLRVHRSYVVAIDKIDAIRSKTLFIKNFEIPIGSSYEKAVLNNKQIPGPN